MIMYVSVTYFSSRVNEWHVQQLRALYTVQDIRGLKAREVEIYLEGYGLPSYLDNPKQAIAKVIGCSVVV